LDKGDQEYKFRRKKDDRPETRAEILREIDRLGPLRYKHAGIRQAAIADRHGDALDRVIAAFATFKAIGNQTALVPGDNKQWKSEGYVYV